MTKNMLHVFKLQSLSVHFCVNDFSFEFDIKPGVKTTNSFNLTLTNYSSLQVTKLCIREAFKKKVLHLSNRLGGGGVKKEAILGLLRPYFFQVTIGLVSGENFRFIFGLFN